ncbi:hypothetical protein A1A1_02777 [Planococcus antarcticus DSM 14505]|uniref:DUF4306 domain-containing protein n=1 Tax=Planococcus antarcticus DSM 14505 TaxID=1185653 RepID=A0AA87ING3_9BACL|nr:DUF4306 domain-containing protein [Planococcus antarcticus]EIM07981.1 hypothetical protein A1A1_02777 [Planococcus antarcticus DSM 14505]
MHNETTRKSRQPILFFGALIFFAAAAFSSLYEGSQLDYMSWEWPYSAVFTNWLNGGVASADDILTIDYLVYAAKFEPLFPTIMFFTALVLFLQVSFWIFKGKASALSVFHIVCAGVFFVLGGALMASPTAGLALFSRIFFITGLIMLISGVTSLVKARKLTT